MTSIWFRVSVEVTFNVNPISLDKASKTFISKSLLGLSFLKANTWDDHKLAGAFEVTWNNDVSLLSLFIDETDGKNSIFELNVYPLIINISRNSWDIR